MIYKTELSVPEKLGEIVENIVLKLRDWRTYKDKVVSYTKPHIKMAGRYANETADKVNKIYKKNKRKVRHNIRMVQFRNTLDIIKNIVVIGTAVIALFSLIIKLFDDLND